MPSRKPSPLSYDGIERLADSLRQIALKEDKKLKGNTLVRWFVERLGGRAEVQSMWGTEEPSGSLTIRGEGDFTIYLSPYSSELRDVFTIAHELAHYFLHCDFKKPGTAVFHRRDSNREEWQANRFAGALLMPKVEFCEVWEMYNKDVWLISSHFGVSVAATNTRAQSLKLE